MKYDRDNVQLGTLTWKHILGKTNPNPCNTYHHLKLKIYILKLTIIDNTVTSMSCPSIHSIFNEIFQRQ